MKRNKALGSSWLSPELIAHHEDPSIYEALAAVLNIAMAKGVPPPLEYVVPNQYLQEGGPILRW